MSKRGAIISSIDNDKKRSRTENSAENINFVVKPNEDSVTLPGSVFQKVIRLIGKNKAKKVWESFDSSLQENPIVAFSFLNKSVISFSELPTCIREDKQCLIDGLEKDRLDYFTLPQDMQLDIDLAVSAINQCRHNISIVLDHNFPEILHQSEEFWKKGYHKLTEVIKKEQAYYPLDYLLWHAPHSIISNSKLMIELVALNGEVAYFMHDSLMEDNKFVQEVLKTNFLALPHFTSRTFRIFPDLIENKQLFKYIKTKGSDIVEIEMLLFSLDIERWKNEDFVREWISLGGRINNRMPKKILDDDDLMLSYAKTIANHFELMSERLLCNKTFIEKICSIENLDHFRFIKCIPENAKNDYDIMLLAYGAKLSNSLPPIDDSIRRPFKNWLRKTLKAHEEKKKNKEGFFKGILCGCAPCSGSPLVALDQYSELKREISSYLDFPEGNRLDFLHRAAKNLKMKVN